MKTRILFVLLIFSLLLIPARSVAASEVFQPQDPGVGSLQDASIQATLDWLVRQPPALNYPVLNTAEAINRASLDAIALNTGSYGNLRFTGFDASLTRMNSSTQVILSGFDPFFGGPKPPSPPPPQNNCTSSITPGIISLVGVKNSPNYPVVVGQDPLRSGVHLTWVINILPTVYTYGLWQRVCETDQCKANGECDINNSGKDCYLGYDCVPKDGSNSGNGLCQPNGDQTYFCVDYKIFYPEDFVTLTPKAILTTPSRNWILGELARAYPGSRLIHPDWSFQATEPCVWDGDICIWTHSEGHVLVADPGWYDLTVDGMTKGTDITPPRPITLVGGHFGVYLVESSITR